MSDSEGEDYEIEAIVDDRMKRNKLQYFVKWKGYGSEDNSWVDEKDCQAPDLVKAYKDEKKRRLSKKRKNFSPKQESPVPKKNVKETVVCPGVVIITSDNSNDNASDVSEEIVKASKSKTKNSKRETSTKKPVKNFPIFSKKSSQRVKSPTPEKSLSPDLESDNSSLDEKPTTPKKTPPSPTKTSKIDSESPVTTKSPRKAETSNSLTSTPSPVSKKSARKSETFNSSTSSRNNKNSEFQRSRTRTIVPIDSDEEGDVNNTPMSRQSVDDKKSVKKHKKEKTEQKSPVTRRSVGVIQSSSDDENYQPNHSKKYRPTNSPDSGDSLPENSRFLRSKDKDELDYKVQRIEAFATRSGKKMVMVIDTEGEQHVASIMDVANQNTEMAINFLWARCHR